MNCLPTLLFATLLASSAHADDKPETRFVIQPPVLVRASQSDVVDFARVLRQVKEHGDIRTLVEMQQLSSSGDHSGVRPAGAVVRVVEIEVSAEEVVVRWLAGPERSQMWALT